MVDGREPRPHSNKAWHYRSEQRRLAIEGNSREHRQVREPWRHCVTKSIQVNELAGDRWLKSHRRHSAHRDL